MLRVESTDSFESQHYLAKSFQEPVPCNWSVEEEAEHLLDATSSSSSGTSSCRGTEASKTRRYIHGVALNRRPTTLMASLMKPATVMPKRNYSKKSRVNASLDEPNRDRVNSNGSTQRKNWNDTWDEHPIEDPFSSTRPSVFDCVCGTFRRCRWIVPPPRQTGGGVVGVAVGVRFSVAIGSPSTTRRRYAEPPSQSRATVQSAFAIGTLATQLPTGRFTIHS